jgi:ferrochelatase
VRRYLKQFLSDPFVIDIPAVARFLLVRGIILPTRPPKSAEAYAKIWTDRGSPLLFHTLDLAGRVRALLGDSYVVEPCMRYGNPSVASAVLKLAQAGVGRVIALPLYPQYSLAATESSLVEIDRCLCESSLGEGIPVRQVQDFFEHPLFIDAFAARIEKSLRGFDADHVLLSFHGVPERHVRKTDPTGAHCLAGASCCDRIVQANRKCYRAQCYATARAIASKLRLEPARWSVSFQSRLGRTPWIQPYTDVVYEELARRGVRRLAVACPAFVADCLETLEEIALRGRESFRELGGEDLLLVPSLNSEPDWARAVASLVTGAG